MTEKREKNQDEARVEVHYRLTHEEFLTWIEKHDLKWSEVKLYLYFCTLNPFGDREIEFSPDELYQKLKIKKSAFYSAAARLEKLGLLSLKLLRAKARVFPINRTTFQSNGKLSNQMENFPIERTTFHLNGKLSNQMENEEPEPSPDMAPTSPHTIQTYSDFIHTLSDSERENFEKYVREEWKRLTTKSGEPGEEIISLERFLAREEDQKNWWDRFVNSSAGRAAKVEAEAKQYDWENDPRLMDWLHKCFYIGYAWTQEDEAEREQRTAFLRWAQKINAYRGRIADEPL